MRPGTDGSRRRPRGKTVLARFLQENSIQTVAFDDEHASVALDAYSRFGQGRHPAALNFGDCCAYAVPRRAGKQATLGSVDRGTGLARFAVKASRRRGIRRLPAPEYQAERLAIYG
jgi:hypothetical protein